MKKILKFIIKTFDKFNFERMQEIDKDCKFKNYKHFIKHNKICLIKCIAK